MGELRTVRTDEYRLRLPRQGGMLLDAEVFASERVPLEPRALRQLADAACLAGVSRVLATPDIHVGYGVPIGAVLAAEDFVSPAAVGYDINCGMRMLTTRWRADAVDVGRLARQVRREIPLGEGKANLRMSPRGLRRVLAEGVAGLLQVVEAELAGTRLAWLLDHLDLQQELSDSGRIERHGSLPADPAALPPRAFERGLPQLGTLGGGNHFIEFQKVVEVLDEDTAAAWGVWEQQLVIMIHSGSRGLGHEVGGHFMKLAARYDREHGIEIPNSQLAVLPLDSRPGRSYLDAMNAAANFAFANRQLMAMLVKGAIAHLQGPVAMRTVYDVAHNLAARERHAGVGEVVVHRKGATRAFPAARMNSTAFAGSGQPVLVPGSMGTASWLLRGVDSGEVSLFSTNHGAGRVLSRKAARGGKGKPGAVSDRQFDSSMAGIELICENRRTIKEEAPAAYKDIDVVIDTVIGAGLAAPVARMMPLAVLKG